MSFVASRRIWGGESQRRVVGNELRASQIGSRTDPILQADNVPKTAQRIRDSGLQIMVTDRWYNMPTAEEALGSYEAPRPHPEITQGKAGGYNG